MFNPPCTTPPPPPHPPRNRPTVAATAHILQITCASIPALHLAADPQESEQLGSKRGVGHIADANANPAVHRPPPQMPGGHRRDAAQPPRMFHLNCTVLVEDRFINREVPRVRSTVTEQQEDAGEEETQPNW